MSQATDLPILKHELQSFFNKDCQQNYVKYTCKTWNIQTSGMKLKTSGLLKNTGLKKARLRAIKPVQLVLKGTTPEEPQKMRPRKEDSTVTVLTSTAVTMLLTLCKGCVDLVFPKLTFIKYNLVRPPQPLPKEGCSPHHNSLMLGR